MSRALSCGVLVTDGAHLLIGHATRSARWDIPKGLAEPGETPDAAARRELLEETGLQDPALTPIGQFSYLPRKDLHLSLWLVAAMPDPASLRCRSTFLVSGKALPEFDRFACPNWACALPRLGKTMSALLAPLAQQRGWM